MYGIKILNEKIGKPNHSAGKHDRGPLFFT